MDDGCHVKGRSRLSLIEGSAIFKADWQLRFENFEVELSVTTYRHNKKWRAFAVP